jgi:hypothetical protein
LLLLECLDFSEVLNGGDPEGLRLGRLLRAVFEPYGELCRMRLFPEQEAAAVEFAEKSASAQARINEDRRMIGRKPVHIAHLRLYPTDEVIDDAINQQLQLELQGSMDKTSLPEDRLPLTSDSRQPAGSLPPHML